MQLNYVDVTNAVTATPNQSMEHIVYVTCHTAHLPASCDVVT